MSYGNFIARLGIVFRPPRVPVTKVYKVLLSHDGNATSPMPVVLENTIGNIVWSRSAEGIYI